MLIGGQWVDALSGKTFEDIDPYDGKVYATVPMAGLDDVEHVMAAAYEARAPWVKTPPIERTRIIQKAAEILGQSADEFADVLIHEGGSTVSKAMFEISQTVELLETASGDCKRIMGETFHNEPEKLSMSFRKPRGTIVAISPWNFPLILSMYKVAYGLATGNTVVLKPASQTPVIGIKIGELFERAGLPGGALNVITGPGGGAGRRDDRRQALLVRDDHRRDGYRTFHCAAVRCEPEGIYAGTGR